jgi:acetyl esterase/lipase
MKFSLFLSAMLIAGAMAVCSPAVNAQMPFANNAITTDDNITVYRDLPYVSNAGNNQKLDLYIPKKVKKPALVVMVHGGAYLGGDKSQEPTSLFLNAGYAVASINYRLSYEALFPAQIIDCKSAVRWLRANADKYGYDTNRFGAYGESAGGHLVAMLGTSADTTKFDVGDNLTYSSRVQVVGDFYGLSDFLQMDAHRLPNGWQADQADSPAAKLIGGPIQENKEKTEVANPIVYITKNTAPFYIAHGDQDTIVPHYESVLLTEALKKASIPVTFYTVTGAGHGFNDKTANEQVVAYFNSVLIPKK